MRGRGRRRRRPVASPQPETAGARAVAVDLLDAAATGRAIAKPEPEVVYHLAALGLGRGLLERPGAALTENTLATLNLLEAVRSRAPDAAVVVVGSGEIYGPPRVASRRRERPAAPAESLCGLEGRGRPARGHLRGRPRPEIVRVRAFNHAGPRQSTDYVVASLTRQVADRTGGRRRARCAS